MRPGSAAKRQAHQIAEDVLLGREMEILEDIHHPGIAAAIWQRTPQPDFQNWLEQLPVKNLPKLRVVTPLENVEAAVRVSCDQVNMPACTSRDMLIEDITALACTAGKILQCANIRLRLDVADSVMCPKFHVDAVPARLLCTYRGAGTQYVPESQLGQPGVVRSVQAGSVALFRGANWSLEEETGLLHRSPDMDTGDLARLLLVVDPVETYI